MINLWYEESYWSYTGGRMSGPEMVVKNTISSLNEIKINYAINSDTYNYNFLIQYQHDIAVKKHEKLEHSSCIIGPQIWPFDGYGKFLLENPNYYKKVIVPSEWVKNLFVNKIGFSPNKVSIWPVGIEVSNKISDEYSIDCLIYYKNRDISELNFVRNFLCEKNINFIELNYGSYTPTEFKDVISKVKFCFIIDGSESQGIAIQEMMAYNKPLFVWDVKVWDYMGKEYEISSTSVPYWNEKCGKRFYATYEINEAFEEFYANIDTYEPKILVDDELSYKSSIEKLIKIFEE